MHLSAALRPWARPAALRHGASHAPCAKAGFLRRFAGVAGPECSRAERSNVRTAAAVEEVEFSADDEADTYIEEYTGSRREGGGYTPHEFITFSDVVLRHEVVTRVEAPLSKCFAIWSDRFNWMQWFDMIEEMGFHDENPDVVTMYLWYRWATTPFLELQVSLERTDVKENEHILEEPVPELDSAPLVAAVLFEEEAGEDGALTGATLVKFRLSYQLPDVLKDFCGKLAVWGDVDRKLQKCMARMRLFVEGVDLAALQEQRAQDWQAVRDGFPEQQRLRAEEEQRAQRAHAEWKQQAAEAAAEEEAEAQEVEAQLGAKTAEQQEGWAKQPEAAAPVAQESVVAAAAPAPAPVAPEAAATAAAEAPAEAVSSGEWDAAAASGEAEAKAGGKGRKAAKPAEGGKKGRRGRPKKTE